MLLCSASLTFGPGLRAWTQACSSKTKSNRFSFKDWVQNEKTNIVAFSVWRISPPATTEHNFFYAARSTISRWHRWHRNPVLFTDDGVSGFSFEIAIQIGFRAYVFFIPRGLYPTHKQCHLRTAIQQCCSLCLNLNSRAIDWMYGNFLFPLKNIIRGYQKGCNWSNLKVIFFNRCLRPIIQRILLSVYFITWHIFLFGKAC